MMPQEQSNETSSDRSELVPKPALAERYSELFISLELDAMLAQHQRMLELADRIEAQYPDYRRYQVYHWLTGSSPTFAKQPLTEDFSGELSVNKFLQDFIERHS